MKKRDKLLYKYSKYKLKNSQLPITIYNEYKLIRNQVTKLKRNNKLDYYKKFFDTNKSKMSAIWKGIRSIVNINNTSKKDILLLLLLFKLNKKFNTKTKKM